MAWLDRIWQATRAQLNHLARAAEDPAEALERAAYEMETHVLQMRQAVAQAIATQKRTERQARQSEAIAEDWERRARLALTQSDEPLAREALSRRQSHLDTARGLRSQLEQQSGLVTRLKQDLRDLERQVAATQIKKDLYLARAQSAEATRRMRELLTGAAGAATQTIFDRMEARVLELEAQAELMAASSVETQFDQLEQAAAVDAELAALKAEQGGDRPADLPPPSAG
ncbi:MAG: PspA/IM30 family protein [Spirulinaceae cyanobacterium RM2_2_10]|nr:PspA/IM30 family protein [Spirulinaceae cyanobacterium SM2_1_0]NJO20489.1 PspA/IM30 family protein [Spirulinaceae cyanobacterium RM2_2_10]